MIGIEINFVDNSGVIIDNCGPFFDNETFYKEAQDDCKTWLLTKSGTIIMNCNEYLGNELDYDFNDCLRMIECNNINDFNELF
jgi:hypothetical protein